MMAPRRDVRNIGLFRLAFLAKAANGKRVKNIAPYRLDDVIAALQLAVNCGKAAIYYNFKGDPVEGMGSDDVVHVVLEGIRKERDDKNRVQYYVLRFSYLNPMAADRGKRTITTNVNGGLKRGQRTA